MKNAARPCLFLCSAIALTGVAVAEPQKAPPATSQPQQRPVEIVLASAETVNAPAAANAQPGAPAKRRIARVTSCRCGDLQPEEAESQDQ